MKLLFAHDESNCSDAALNDLSRAGLPQDIEAIFFTVVDHRLVSQPSSLALFGVSAAPAAAMYPDYERNLLESAREPALSVARIIHSKFPSWSVSAGASLGSPVSEILDRAQRWKADLIIVGSHDRSLLGRFFLGSVSQDIVKNADCSVRVGRGSAVERDQPVRLVVGVDGSAGSRAAVRAVASRIWPEGSEARVLAALDLMASAAPRSFLARRAEESEELLRTSGLACSAAVKVGEASCLLTHEAEAWAADCIFVGARGVSGLGRRLLGSTSAAVAANATCSVEVVRPAKS